MKRTVEPEDMMDVKYGRGKGQSNARAKKEDMSETDDETVKVADKEARGWHGSKKSVK